MKILDPQSGETIDTDTWDQTNLAIMPERHMIAAQKRMWPEPKQPFDAFAYDHELQRDVLTRFMSDPGDEM